MDNRARALLEAALFQASDPLSLEKLAEVVDDAEPSVEAALRELADELDAEHRGVEIFEKDGMYQMRVKKAHSDDVAHLTPHADLSRGLLKVLALVVYKQPITQSEIVKTIGNRAYSYVRELEERGLINTEKFGRTKKLELTEHFMNYFGISSRKDLIRLMQQRRAERGDEEPGESAIEEVVIDLDRILEEHLPDQ